MGEDGRGEDQRWTTDRRVRVNVSKKGVRVEEKKQEARLDGIFVHGSFY